MKIAMFVPTFPCPSETFILNQISGVVDRNDDVHVYANYRGDFPNNIAGLEEYGLRGKVSFFTYGQNAIPVNRVLRLVKACFIFMELMPKGGWALVRSLNVLKYGIAAASLSLFYQAAILLRNGSYDIVHCHFGQTGIIAAMLKDIGVIKGKIITTFYGYDISEFVQANGSEAYGFLFAQGDVFVAISEEMKERLIQLGGNKEKVVTHRLGVDLSQFHFSPRAPIVNGELHILSVGRFVEKKGLAYGIHAIAELVKEYPNIIYQIIGDGELRDEITQLIAALNLEGNVQLLGWKTPDEVSQAMGWAHVFLAPSVTSVNGDQEGTPTVIIEALARGLPVLSTFHSGIPELIQDNQTGFLVSERDAKSLTQKLRLLFQHPEQNSEMGKAGRDWVEQFHDINRLNDRLVRLYEQELERKS